MLTDRGERVALAMASVYLLHIAIFDSGGTLLASAPLSFDEVGTATATATAAASGNPARYSISDAEGVTAEGAVVSEAIVKGDTVDISLKIGMT
jgi:hypothetical protein